ncbi:MAG TPA: SLC13 family permease [Candidatus Hydrogenedentes bacterium]|nr:SLC13 family permease [Candidatus Hydrogenedentota bacterium]HOL76263.1 SLC13 family permease [Candidatus Hydrogenedentota bacterium]HPO86802.1 SLC13 family permease [Candidatus Hydrogenedentota bacterium]
MVPWQALVTLVAVALAFVGLALNLAPDAMLLAALLIVLLAGIVSPQEAFQGFSNEGMLTVAALFVVSAALRETGALDLLGRWVFGKARQERGALVRLAATITPLSAFLNNTPIVAMFIPVVMEWCKKHRVPPSRLLLSLSYLSILGGTCTLIGTSTNIVVNGLLAEASRTHEAFRETLRPMSLFELSYVGVPYAVIGVLYLLFIAPRLLPARKDLVEQFAEASREYLVNMKILSGCRLIGSTVEEAGLRHLPGLFLIEISRGDQLIAPAPPDTVLKENDILTFTGVVDTIADLERIPHFVPLAQEESPSPLKNAPRMLTEAVVSPRCPCIGKTIRDADFRALYNAAVVAVHRNGERLQGKVGDIVLRAGDTLLLHTGPHFARAHRNNPDFLLVGAVEHARPVRSEKVLVSLLLMGLLIVLMASGKVSTLTAAFLVAALMVGFRCISVADARQSVDWQTLITIGASFGLGKALEKSGAPAAVAEWLVATSGNWGPYAVLACVYIGTGVVTEMITNNAAAVLLFPFAVAIANSLGVSPRPFVMAVIFAASASFITPIGYQTNLMVYGPGGYRLGDFVRVGLPLHLVLWVAATVLIPSAWHF